MEKNEDKRTIQFGTRHRQSCKVGNRHHPANGLETKSKPHQSILLLNIF